MLKSRSSLLIACLVVVYIVWGSTYLAIRIALDGLPPLLMATLRNLVAGPLVLGWMLWRGAARPTARQWRNGVLMGIMMMGLGNGCVCLAEQLVPSGIAALFVGGAPVFAILFSLGFGALLYLIVFGSILAYSAFVYVINHSRPALATSYAYVNPVVAVGLGAAFAAEQVSGAQLLGMAVILAGVALVVIGHARER